MTTIIGSLMIGPFILAVGAGVVRNELEIANQ